MVFKDLSAIFTLFCFLLISVVHSCVPASGPAAVLPSTILAPSTLSSSSSTTTTTTPTTTTQTSTLSSPTTEASECVPAPNIILTTTSSATQSTTVATTSTTGATVNCFKYSTCESCSDDPNCGWCDTVSACVLGNSSDAMFFDCTNWFYRNCITADDSTTCSDQISKLNCLENICDNATSAKEKFDCQKCHDFHDCFKDNSDTCRTWDEEKCPGGKLNPNLTDPERIELTVIKPEVLNIDHTNTTLYICNMVDSIGPVTVIAVQEPTENYMGRILSSRQAGVVLHNITSVTERGSWVFGVTEKVELTDVLEHAEFGYQVADIETVTDFIEDDTPADNVITGLKETLNTDYSLYHGHDMTGVQHMYKLIGRTIIRSDDETMNLSVLAVPKADAPSFEMDDIIFANNTDGYLEVVDEVQSLSPDEILLKTHLAQIDTTMTHYNADTLKLSENKSFACAGGEDLLPGISVFAKGIEESWVAPGNVIVGRASTAAALQIAAIYNGGDFILYEGYPVISVGEGGEISTSFGPSDLTTAKRSERASFETTKDFHITFGTSCAGLIKKFCKACEDVKCNMNFDIKPTLSVAAVLAVDFIPFNIDAGIGAQIVLDAAATSDISLKPGASFTAVAKLFGPISKTFVVLVGVPPAAVPVPGNIDFEINAVLALTLVGDLTIGVVASGNLVKTYTGQAGDVKLPPPRDSQSVSVTPKAEPFKGFKRVTASIDIGAVIGAAWPSIGAGATLALEKWVKRWDLPEWIEGRIIRVLNSTKLDIYVQVEGGFGEIITAESCKCCRTDKEKPHSITASMGPYLSAEGGAHVLWTNPQLLTFDKFWPIFSSGFCTGPDFGLCNEEDASCVAKSLAFVIDDTGSMHDDIDSAINGATNIFQAATSMDSDIVHYVLVTFNDPGFGLFASTNVSSAFLAALRGVTAYGGDASAKDYSLGPAIYGLIEEKSCQINYVLTGSCSDSSSRAAIQSLSPEYGVNYPEWQQTQQDLVHHETNDTTDGIPVDIRTPNGIYHDTALAPGDQIYYDTALASNGHIFHVASSNVSDVIHFVETRFHARPIENLDIDNATNHSILFPVDSHLSGFSVSISGQAAGLTLYSPNGVEVDYEKLVDLPSVLVVRVANAVRGEWKAVPEVALGFYSIEITGTGSMDFQFGFSQSLYSDLLDRVPVFGKSTYIFARLTNHTSPAIAQRLKIVSLNGSEMMCAQLSYHSDHEYQYVGGPVLLPSETFRMKIFGKDENGFSFQRITSRAVSLSCTEDLLITGVISGPLEGELPKAIELYAINDIPDMGIYGIGLANESVGHDVEQFRFPAVAASAGLFLYIATESVNFYNFIGFSPTFVHAEAAFVTGNNAVQLFKNGIRIDQFGYVGVDGSGSEWDYNKGWTYRKSDTCPASNFSLSEWSFSGPDALDSALTNADAAPNQWPIGTFSP